MSIMADLFSPLIDIMIVLSLTRKVKLILIIDVAAIVTWVVNDWLEAANVGIE